MRTHLLLTQSLTNLLPSDFSANCKRNCWRCQPMVTERVRLVSVWDATASGDQPRAGQNIDMFDPKIESYHGLSHSVTQSVCKQFFFYQTKGKTSLSAQCVAV